MYLLRINKGNDRVMSSHDEQERHAKAIQLVRDAVQNDAQLRQKYEVGDKFRFVRERLTALLENLENHLSVPAGEVKTEASSELNDEVIVYVYLYNAQGALLRSWQPLLIPKVFYEYSVNRPIYTDKSHIENVIRSKPNRQQHAYLTISIKRHDILSSGNQQDALGNPLVKIREGTLYFKNLVVFAHNNEEYVVGANGEIIKK